MEHQTKLAWHTFGISSLPIFMGIVHERHSQFGLEQSEYLKRVALKPVIVVPLGVLSSQSICILITIASKNILTAALHVRRQEFTGGIKGTATPKVYVHFAHITVLELSLLCHLLPGR